MKECANNYIIQFPSRKYCFCVIFSAKRIFILQSSAETESVVEPASETTFRRREHRIWRAAHFSQWIRRAPSQVTTSGTARPSQEDRCKGAHRSREGKPLSISQPRGRRRRSFGRYSRKYPTMNFSKRSILSRRRDDGIHTDVFHLDI